MRATYSSDMASEKDRQVANNGINSNQRVATVEGTGQGSTTGIKAGTTTIMREKPRTSNASQMCFLDGERAGNQYAPASPSPRGVEGWESEPSFVISDMEMRPSSPLGEKELSFILEGKPNATENNVNAQIRAELDALTRPGSADTQDGLSMSAEESENQTRMDDVLMFSQTSMLPPSPLTLARSQASKFQRRMAKSGTKAKRLQKCDQLLDSALQLQHMMGGRVSGKSRPKPPSTQIEGIVPTGPKRTATGRIMKGWRWQNPRCLVQPKQVTLVKNGRYASQRRTINANTGINGGLGNVNFGGLGKGYGIGKSFNMTDDEIKRMRRVKNRESVEKCRMKQRLRMEALQVEQTCLVGENKTLTKAVEDLERRLKEVHECAPNLGLSEKTTQRLSTVLQSHTTTT